MPDLNLPSLGAPYDEALRTCVDQIFHDYDVVGIVVSGTIVRGTPDRRSDLDVHVLHKGNFRERVQAWYNGVPTEVFVNPPSRIPQYFTDDAADRRPMTAHMFATGVIVYDPDGVTAKLVDEARQSLANVPADAIPFPPPGSYGAATMFEDAEDLSERDPEAAALILGQAVYDLAMCRAAAEPGWRPRAKDLLKRLREIDPESAELVVQATSAMEFKTKLEAGRKLCLRVTGADGFFEWRSPREETL